MINRKCRLFQKCVISVRMRTHLLASVSPVDHGSWLISAASFMTDKPRAYIGVAVLHTIAAHKVVWLLAFLRRLLSPDFWYRCSSNPARPLCTAHFQAVWSDAMVSQVLISMFRALISLLQPSLKRRLGWPLSLAPCCSSPYRRSLGIGNPPSLSHVQATSFFFSSEGWIWREFVHL